MKMAFLFVFLGLHPQHMEVPRLGVKLELELPAYTTATASPDPSLVYSLHHSSRQHQILNPLSKARDQTHILMDHSQFRYHWGMMAFLFYYFFTASMQYNSYSYGLVSLPWIVLQRQQFYLPVLLHLQWKKIFNIVKRAADVFVLLMAIVWPVHHLKGSWRLRVVSRLLRTASLGAEIRPCS